MDEFYNNSRARFPEFRASILGFSRRIPLLCEEGNTVLRRNAMKICMVGQGAFAKKHLEGLKRIRDAEVISIFGRTAETTEAVAQKYDIPHWTTNFDEALARPGLEAVILTSPTPNESTPFRKRPASWRWEDIHGDSIPATNGSTRRSKPVNSNCNISWFRRFSTAA